jgi:hypothetical protein
MRTWHEVTPLGDQYDGVVELAELDGIDEDLECWCLELVSPVRIVRSQLIDDPDDTDGWRKVADLRAALQRDEPLPPLILCHQVAGDSRHTLVLYDGRHRFNAATLEGRDHVSAWVAHPSCCREAAAP